MKAYSSYQLPDRLIGESIDQSAHQLFNQIHPTILIKNLSIKRSINSSILQLIDRPLKAVDRSENDLQSTDRDELAASTINRSGLALQIEQPMKAYSINDFLDRLMCQSIDQSVRRLIDIRSPDHFFQSIEQSIY